MKIGIIGAMEIEVSSIISALTDRRETQLGKISFHEGTLRGADCVVARCGIGKVNAAICTQMMIDRFAPSLIINTGVAGGIGKNVKIGDIVVATACVQHDMDSTALGDPIGYISSIDTVELPCDSRARNVLVQGAKSLYGGVHTGVIATGDQFIANPDRCRELGNTFSALACEMEGGSIAHVCYVNGVRCAVLRAVSDNADDNGKVNFTEFATASAEKCVSLLQVCAPELAAQREASNC